jgi:hypothetical protein
VKINATFFFFNGQNACGNGLATKSVTGIANSETGDVVTVDWAENMVET